MAKVTLWNDCKRELVYGFFCAGCRCSHTFRIRYESFTRDSQGRPDNVPLWTWNGDFEKPTISPSIDCNRSYPERRCHSIVTDGMIRYLGDSYHHLKNQTVPLEDDD